MKTIQAFIQMGPIRRETTIEIPEDEFRRVKEKAEEDGALLDHRLEEYVLDWLHAQYGWGWSGCGFEIDYSIMEGASDGGYKSLMVTSESSIPNTETKLLRPPHWREVEDETMTGDSQ